MEHHRRPRKKSERERGKKSDDDGHVGVQLERQVLECGCASWTSSKTAKRSPERSGISWKLRRSWSDRRSFVVAADDDDEAALEMKENRDPPRYDIIVGFSQKKKREEHFFFHFSFLSLSSHLQSYYSQQPLIMCLCAVLPLSCR